jgi:N6-adenosine-specific RNA methylase IME4
MENIIIDPEFKALIPPLAPEELAQLEANILQDGCRDPLVTWQGIIIDGHNRHAICTKHDLPFKTATMKFEDRDHACAWMLENQLGRRNLTDDQRAMKADDLAEVLSKIEVRERASKAVETREIKAGRKKAILSDDASDKIAPKPKKDTRAKVAKQNKVSERKMKQARKVKTSSPEMAKKVDAGELSLADAVREIKRSEVITKLEDVAAVEAKALEGKYDVIVIDPPWPMQKIERDVAPNQVAFEYPTMTEAELAEMQMPAAEDCHMWLWTTHKFLPMALRLLDEWKFKYVCAFVWHKPGGFQPIGLPQYNCEFALYARKGSPKFIDTKAFPVCFNAPRGAHSEKPEEFYDVIRRVTAGRRIDIFNRRKIDGFDVWGKEAADA